MDYAAATPVDPTVLTAMKPYFSDRFYNPSAMYLGAKSVRADIETARRNVAGVLGVRASEIIFTAGATEANNLAIHGVMTKFPGCKMLVSAIEHDSVLEPAKQYNHAIIPVHATGHINLDKFRGMIAADDVVLVSIVYANNEIGTVQHMASIAKLIRQERGRRIANGNTMPLYFHTDAAQAPNDRHILAKRIGVDLMSLNGGKIYGPKQSGALFVATGVQLNPLIYGGGQEFGLRSGTENVANIVGFSHALVQASAHRQLESIRLAKLQVFFIKELVAHVPGVHITAPAAGLHTIVHIVIQGVDNERLMMQLDEVGIICAVGSACSASKKEPSRVLRAIGMSDEAARSSLRFSMGRHTDEAAIIKTVKVLKQLVV